MHIGFEDDRVTESECRGDRAYRQDLREVPRADDADDSERQALVDRLTPRLGRGEQVPLGLCRVFTNDVDRTREVARQLRSSTVGHNAFRTDFGMAFGGFKQSGIGREGGREGLLPFLETKTVILEGRPAGYGSSVQ
jgi:Aldehyde dehydrogenase family